MKIGDITTALDFREFVRDLIRRYSLTDRTMGEYLRALWAAVLEHKDDLVTYGLLAQLLEAAYVVEPLPFDMEWLKERQPAWTWDSATGTYIIKGYDEETKSWVIKERNVDPFCILKHTILAQISERYLLETTPGDLSEKQYRQLENDWSNPHPYPYLESAMLAMYSEAEEQVAHQQTEMLTWAELAAILSIGKIYD